MFKRLLVAAAVSLSAVPLHAQATTFSATGGEVTFQLTSYPTLTPMQLYIEAVGAQSRHLLVENTGTGNADLSLISLGSFAAGTALSFSWVINGFQYGREGILSTTIVPNGFWVEFRAGQPATTSDAFAWFNLAGVTSPTNLECTPNNHVLPCSTDSQRVTANLVTSTPEPGTVALFATGMAGLIPVAIRRRKRAA